jgi:hypothetical protein
MKLRFLSKVLFIMFILSQTGWGQQFPYEVLPGVKRLSPLNAQQMIELQKFLKNSENTMLRDFFKDMTKDVPKEILKGFDNLTVGYVLNSFNDRLLIDERSSTRAVCLNQPQGTRAKGGGLFGIASKSKLEYMKSRNLKDGDYNIQELGDTKTPDALVNDLFAGLLQQNIVRNEVIVVIDEFALDSEGVLDALDIEKLITVDPFVEAQGLEEATSHIMHGNLVLHHLINLIKGIDVQGTPMFVLDENFVQQPSKDEPFQVFAFKVDKKFVFEPDNLFEQNWPQLFVLALNSNQSNSIFEDVRPVRRKTEDLTNSKDTPIIVNLSFSFIPCPILDYYQDASTQFEEAVIKYYNEEVLRKKIYPLGVDFYQLAFNLVTVEVGTDLRILGLKLYEMMTNKLIDDFFKNANIDVSDINLTVEEKTSTVLLAYAFLKHREQLAITDAIKFLYEGSGGTNNFIFASSGNRDAQFLLPPATLSDVYSISSSNVKDPNKSSGFSDVGHIMLPGAWYRFTDSTNDGHTLIYGGTSFSSPLFSLFMAIDRMQKTPRCNLLDLSRDDRTLEDFVKTNCK